MPILDDDKQNIPVIVALKAETAMQIAVAMVAMPHIPADEMQKLTDAITMALKI